MVHGSPSLEEQLHTGCSIGLTRSNQCRGAIRSLNVYCRSSLQQDPDGLAGVGQVGHAIRSAHQGRPAATIHVLVRRAALA